MSPASPVFWIQVTLSSAIQRAGVSALLTQAGFWLEPSPERAVTPPGVMVIDEHYLLTDLPLPDLPLVGLGASLLAPAQLMESAQRGWAWLPADATAAELQAAVIGAAAGLVVVTPAQLDDLASPGAPERSVQTALHDALTVREREVLGLVAQGLSNKRVALRLGISENTVKFHLQSLFSKLGVNSRAGAATRAAQLGLIFV
ncbi:response regulator transcription factor [Deinococcus sp.]|uniref:response regulator transcription factor n=1 Tax=Deinococcus sp. TaxID=47478 RepID=UPI003C7A5882